MKRKAKWEPDEILAAIRDYVAEHGEVPAATDFNPGDCERSARIALARAHAWTERAGRFRTGVYPWPRTVQKAFGSWNAAIREAGYEPRRESMPQLKRYGGDLTRDLQVLADLLGRAQKQTGDELRQSMRQVADLALAIASEEE